MSREIEEFLIDNLKAEQIKYQRKRRIIAIVLSIIFPSLGLFYKKRNIAAFAILFGFIVPILGYYIGSYIRADATFPSIREHLYVVPILVWISGIFLSYW